MSGPATGTESAALTVRSVVIRDPELISSSLNRDVVMMDAESGTYYGLNETAGLIWQFLGDARPVAEVVAQLVEAYDVEPTRCEQEVLEVLEDLRARGLIRVVA